MRNLGLMYNKYGSSRISGGRERERKRARRRFLKYRNLVYRWTRVISNLSEATKIQHFCEIKFNFLDFNDLLKVSKRCLPIVFITLLT